MVHKIGPLSLDAGERAQGCGRSPRYANGRRNRTRSRTRESSVRSLSTATTRNFSVAVRLMAGELVTVFARRSLRSFAGLDFYLPRRRLTEFCVGEAARNVLEQSASVVFLAEASK